MMKALWKEDREFRALSVPAAREEREALEQSLVRRGCLEPILVWQGLIVDGYKRYDICRYEEIAFTVREADFSSRREALLWACRSRLGSTPPKTLPLRYILGRYYLLRKEEALDLRRACQARAEPAGEKSPSLAAVVGALVGVSGRTVESCAALARALDHAASIEPDFFQALMTGRLRQTCSEIQSLEFLDAGELLDRWKKLRHAESLKQRRLQARNEKKSRQEPAEPVRSAPLALGIKEMPRYDPDMELRGLALTVPTWMAAIARAERNTDMHHTSPQARAQLRQALEKLAGQVQQIMEVLR